MNSPKHKTSDYLHFCRAIAPGELSDDVSCKLLRQRFSQVILRIEPYWTGIRKALIPLESPKSSVRFSSCLVHRHKCGSVDRVLKVQESALVYIVRDAALEFNARDAASVSNVQGAASVF